MKHKKLENGYSIILLFASAIVIGGIISCCLSPAIDSDMVEGLFWAEASMSSGHILDPGFIYSYAIPFGSNLMLIPFVHLFGMTQIANSMGMCFFYLLMTATSYLLMRELCHGVIPAVVGTSVIMLAFRSQMGTNLLHHILFYQLGFLCFIGLLAALIHLVQTQEKTIRKRWYICLCFFSVWSGANGLPTILLSGLPIVGGVIIAELAGKVSRKKAVQIGCMVLFGLCAGYVIYKLSMHSIQESSYLENVGSYQFLSIDKWLENLEQLPRVWINFFLVSNPEQQDIISIQGMETLASIFIACLSGTIPIYYLIRIRKLDTKELIVFVGWIGIWMVCLTQYIFARRGVEERVLYNGLCVNFVLLAVFVCKHMPKLPEAKVIVSLIAGAIAVFSVLFAVHAEWNFASCDLSELESHGITYGLASFWNANINTVNSGGSVEVRAVYIDCGTVKPSYYQSRSSWYDSSSFDGDWFLLLQDEEYKDLLNAPNQILLSSCKEIINLQGDYANPNDSERDAYNEVREDQSYKALVFSKDAWDACALGKTYEYNFECSYWARACDYADGARYIHDGGISYGPNMHVNQGSRCHVIIEGENLEHAKIQAYSVQDGQTIDLPLENSVHNDTHIEFDLTASVELSALEVVITNPIDDYSEDILLRTETIDEVSSVNHTIPISE